MKTIFKLYGIYLHLFLTVFFLSYSHNSKAQDEFRCANEVFQTRQLQDSAFIRQLTTIALLQQQNGAAQRITGNVLEIPLVVHVLHLGEPYGTGTNIPDQQIIDAVKATNERWRNTSSTNDPRSVDMEVQFCLAQFDPNGNPSNGITRTDASSMPLYADIGIGYIEAQLQGINGSDEIATKNLSNWPHSYVYNIWVVNKIAGGWGGYAFFPVSGEYSTDGVVITANSMRSTSSTLAHELGHGMSLFHTFQGSENGCPANDICFLQGDWICDTPPHKKTDCDNSICNNSPDSMLSFKNIMSYCGGRGLFTPNQKERVRTSIYNTSRAQLLRSYACSGPPCDTARTFLDMQSCVPANVGVKYDTLSTSKGCDSIIKTTTTLIPVSRTNLNAETCNPASVGITYDTLPNSKGCDSIIKTTTTLIPVSRTELNAETCNPASAGISYDTLPNSEGCDSIIKTTTTLIPVPHASFNLSGSGLTATFTNNSLNAITYTWQFGDDSISHQVAPTHTYLSTGLFTVKLIAENTCSSDTAETVINIQNTGIRSQSSLPKIILYPNPNNGSFTIKADINVNTYLEITNLLGQTIIQQELSPGKEHILSFESKLSKGIYQLSLKEKGKIIGVTLLSIY